MNAPLRGDEFTSLSIMPSDLVDRRHVEWPGLQVDLLAARQLSPFEYGFKTDKHLLIAGEACERCDGETAIEGLPTSTQRCYSGRLTFVPAGHKVWGWQMPKVLARATYVYIDRNESLLERASHLAHTELLPRLAFFDAEIWHIAMRLKAEVMGETQRERYGEALGILLGHELVRLLGTNTNAVSPARGGLSGWQQRKVTDYIEAHLAEDVRLSTLADLVGLSVCHFARAFKQSSGLPPLRYHNSRRIARAKALLATAGYTVTQVAFELGFAEASSFSAAFRRATGMTPREYRRHI